MKKKLFMLLALVCMTLTASAKDVPTYSLTKAGVAEAHGTITFKVGENTVTSAAEGQTVTVILTPATGWAANQPSGQWYAAIAASRNRVVAQGTDIDLLSNFELTAAGENQWTFTMQRANAEVNMSYKKLLTNTDISIEDIEPLTYTGQPLKPTVVVKDGTTTLVKGTDYTVSYSNNTNAGEATAAENAPTVTITAVSTSEKYAGTATKTFTINKATGTISFAEAAYEKTYGDPAFKNTLTYEGDGTVTYSSSMPSVASVDASTGEVTVLRAGTATITATLGDGGNFAGAKASFKVTVSEQVVSDANGTSITLDADGYHIVMDETVGPGMVIPDNIINAEVNYARLLDISGKTPVDIDGEASYLYTVCLPFDPYFNAKFYTLTGVKNNSLQFDEIEGNPKACTPYLVSVTHDVAVKDAYSLDVVIEGHMLTEEEKDALLYNYEADINFSWDVINPDPVDGCQLKGTLRGLTNADAAAEGAYIMQSDGRWGAVKAGNEAVYIPPFRAYIVGAAQNSRSFSSSFGDNATGIERIVTVDRDGTERWYDLQGRPIAKPATKGIYIHNGSKVAIK